MTLRSEFTFRSNGSETKYTCHPIQPTDQARVLVYEVTWDMGAGALCRRYTFEQVEELISLGNWLVDDDAQPFPPEALKAGPIKSDGGSSTYYDIALPAWLLELILERGVAGKAYIKTEELIEVGFSSDFDFGTAFKSLVRAHGATKGQGKAGNSLSYECKKIHWSVDKINSRGERHEDERNV